MASCDLSIVSIQDWIVTSTSTPKISGGPRRARRSLATSEGVFLRVMKRSAAPETRNNSVSRQGFVISTPSRIHSSVWALCTCQSNGP